MNNDYGLKYPSSVHEMHVDEEHVLTVIETLLNDSRIELKPDTMKKIIVKFFQVLKEELPDEKSHSKNVIMLILNQIEDALDNIPYRL